MNKEQKVALVAVLFCSSVFLVNIYMVYLPHREKEATFKVFFVEFWDGYDITQVLTWGDGKYQFIGNWTGQFELDHTYHIVYVQKAGYAKHVYNNLIILDWSEVVE